MVEKTANISNSASKVKSIIQKGQIGDFIQVRRSHGGPHSMILAGYDNTKITIFDCNTDGKCGVKYYKQTYQTFASKNSGMSLYHSTKYPAMKLSKPKITKCEAKSETSIKVEWGKVDNAVKYKLVRTEKDKKNKKTVYEGTGTSHTDTGLKAGTAYYYTAYAENGGKSSDASDTYKMYTKLAAPKIEVKADGASQITVTWDKVQGAKSYTVLGRKTGEKTYATLKSGLTGTSYTDTDHKIKGVKKPLEPGTKYYYRVKAVGAGTVGPAGKLATRTVESDESETKSKFTNMKRPEKEEEAETADLPPYEVNDVTLRSKDGQELEEIPAKGGFDVAVSVVGTTEGFRPSRVVVAAYGANGRLLEVATEAVPEERSAGWACGLRVGETREEIAKVKAFLWDADRGMAPTAYSVTISKDRSDNSDQI